MVVASAFLCKSEGLANLRGSVGSYEHLLFAYALLSNTCSFSVKSVQMSTQQRTAKTQISLFIIYL